RPFCSLRTATAIWRITSGSTGAAVGLSSWLIDGPLSGPSFPVGHRRKILCRDMREFLRPLPSKLTGLLNYWESLRSDYCPQQGGAPCWGLCCLDSRDTPLPDLSVFKPLL